MQIDSNEIQEILLSCVNIDGLIWTSDCGEKDRFFQKQPLFQALRQETNTLKLNIAATLNCGAKMLMNI